MKDSINTKVTKTLLDNKFGLGSAFELSKFRPHPYWLVCEEAPPAKVAGELQMIHLPNNIDPEKRVGRVLFDSEDGRFKRDDLVLFIKDAGQGLSIAGRPIRFLEMPESGADILGHWPAGTWPESLFDTSEEKS